MSDDLMVVVSVVSPEGGGGCRRHYLVNYSVPDTKRWVVRTTVWCAMNGHELTIRAATPEDLATRRLFVAKDAQSSGGVRAA